MSDDDAALRFRNGLNRITFVYLGILVAEWVALAHGDSFFRSSLWVLKTGTVLAWQYAILSANRIKLTRGENLGQIWGWANRITLARGVFLALFAGFLFKPEASGWAAWLPGSIYSIAAIGDFLDGFIARKTGTRTEMGAFMDGEFDGAGILLVMVLAVQYDRLPAPFLLIALAKPAYAAILRIRRMLGGRLSDLPSSYMRRRLAGFQMGVAAVILFPPVDGSLAFLAETLVGLPFLAGFLRDGLAATCRLDPTNPAYLRWKGRLGRCLFSRLPPLLRFASLALASVRIAQAVRGASRGLDAFAPWRSAVLSLSPGLQESAARALATSQVSALILLAIGRPAVAAVSAALVFILTEVLRTSQGRPDAMGLASVAAALLLLILHTGQQRDRK